MFYGLDGSDDLSLFLGFGFGDGIMGYLLTSIFLRFLRIGMRSNDHINCLEAVSYTHLDVYKRQIHIVIQ